jgi:hypothetical protein
MRGGTFKDYKPYGCYGGLHITLFESWDPKFDDIIKRRQGVQDPETGLQSLHRLDLGRESRRRRHARGQGDGQV